MEDLLSKDKKRALKILRQLVTDESLSCEIKVSSIGNVYRQKESGKVFYSIGHCDDSRPLTEIIDLELELQQLAGLYLFKHPRNDFRIHDRDLKKEFEEIQNPYFKIDR